MPVLKAEAPVYGGFVISRNDGIVFIKGAVPGEVVEVSIDEKKRDYSVASVTDIIEPSSYRVEPLCRYFGACGGCQLQFVSYEKQVSMKTEILTDCLERIGDIKIELLPPVTGRNFNYRRRAQFKVSKDGSIGFYKEGTRDVVAIDECPLMVKEINEMLRKLKHLDLSGIKEVHVTYGDSPLALIIGKDFDETLAEQFAEAGFSGIAFQDGSYRANGYVSLDLNGLVYTVSPWSFFQSNWDLNTQVVNIITEELKDLEGIRILDLYAGAGNFSLPLASIASETVAVEDNPYAIKDGQRNASMNNIRKFKFIKAKAEKAKVKGDFEALILNPPRPGLTNEAMKKVLEISPRKIVYISCNPSTFARDLRKLKDKYNIDSVRMIDFFPNTYHIESLAFLTLKKEQ
jgi:23S rRNA (uracil1939-C5)-methyltransferase